MENQLQNLIISAQLTPKEKEVADYVLENLQKCCFMTSTELAGELNVSYSSVIRLTKTLGFTGYPDFQRAQGNSPGYGMRLYPQQYTEHHCQ